MPMMQTSAMDSAVDGSGQLEDVKNDQVASASPDLLEPSPLKK